MIKLIKSKGLDVTINKIVKTGGGYVGAKATPELFLTTKGILNYISGEEQIKNDKQQIIATHKLYLDFRNDLDTSMVVVINSKEYQVSYIENPMNFNKYIVLYLKESD